MQKLLHKLSSFVRRDPFFVLCVVYLATLPFFIGKIVVNQQAFIAGQYINYLHLRITLQTILGVVILYAAVARERAKLKEYTWISIALLVFAVISGITAYSIGAQAHVYETLLGFSSFVHVLQWGIVALALVEALATCLSATGWGHKTFLTIALATSAAVELIIGIFQVILTCPLPLTPLFTLGQPPACTSFSYWGTEIASRMYGTTPHPNILAGILVLYIFVLLCTTPLLKKWYSYIAIVIPLIGIVLTYSRAAYLAVVLLFIIFATRIYAKRIYSWIAARPLILGSIFVATQIVILAFFALITHWQTSLNFIDSRARIQAIYTTLITTKPIFLLTGAGFTMSIPSLLFILPDLPITAIYHNQLLVEPPHNVLLLLITEAGIPLTLLLLFIFGKFALKKMATLPDWQKVAIVVIVSILASFDHYLLY